MAAAGKRPNASFSVKAVIVVFCVALIASFAMVGWRVGWRRRTTRARGSEAWVCSLVSCSTTTTNYYYTTTTTTNTTTTTTLSLINISEPTRLLSS